MLEEKLISKKMNELNDLDSIIDSNELHISQEKIYTQVMKLINKKKTIIFGPEKSKTAKFIAENCMDVYNIIRKYYMENSD